MKKKDNNYGIASLVFGILSIAIPFFGAILGIIGLIMYSQQIKIERNGIATAGLVTSIVGLVIWGLWLIMMVFMFGFFGFDVFRPGMMR